MNATAPLVSVRNLKKEFPIRKGVLSRQVGAVKAVNDVSFDVARGETLGVVGESGCGKTTTGRAILRLIEPTSGEISFEGRDVRSMGTSELRALRREMQIIFQDPVSSLNPRMSIGAIIREGLTIHKLAEGAAADARVRQLLQEVGLRPEYSNRYPHEFSGGQRQRIGIARALAVSPKLIVADEPVSALDVSVRAQVLNLLLDLRRRLGLTMLFVAHDLSVVKHICDRVAVMYVGQLVEQAPTAALFAHPRHPYTAALIRAVPIPDPRAPRGDVALAGEVANPAAPPSGCYFHPRCPYAVDRCRIDPPVLRRVGDHAVRCHRAEELNLAGAF